MTVLQAPADILKALKCGASSFISKPYEDKHLLWQVDYALSNAELRSEEPAAAPWEVVLSGDKIEVIANRSQIFDLLVSVMEKTSIQNEELSKVNNELKAALKEVKTLHGLIPICSHCKKMRTDAGAWEQMEEYISKRSDTQFSHGICPSCAQTWASEIPKPLTEGHFSASAFL